MSCFGDEETCHNLFSAVRFRNGKYCPHCGHRKVYEFNNGRRYRCAGCREDFTIKTGTVFGESKVPLQKWFMALYLLSVNRKGISSVQLAKQIGVTQKTAWFMNHRLREALKQSRNRLSGTIEADETYIGGKEKNKHRSRRHPGQQGRNTLSKTPIFGLMQRGGRVRAKVTSDVKRTTIEGHLLKHAKTGSLLYTDEFVSYSRVKENYRHKIVKHSEGEYVRGDVHSNTIENFWSIFKRGYHGIYHSMSRKHLQRYVDEYAFRFNHRKDSFYTSFITAMDQIAGSSRLGYAELVQKAS